jgi:pseudouridine kinase
MTKPVICIGAAFVDELFHLTEDLIPATTNKANVTKTAGGVSRNIAHQLALLDVPVQLISVFGNDSDGDWLKKTCFDAGVKLDVSLTADVISGKYTGILKPDGSLLAAFVSNPAEYLITPSYLQSQNDLLSTASWLLTDTNTPIESISWLVNFSNQKNIPLVIEPVSVPPARKLRDIDLNGLYLITPNEDELPALCSDKAFTEEQQVNELLIKGVKHIWLHNGKHGSTIYSTGKCVQLHSSTVDVLDSTGAGDGALAGFIVGKVLGKDDMSCLKLAHTLAAEILQVNGAIASHINQQKLLSLVSKYYPEQ